MQKKSKATALSQTALYTRDFALLSFGFLILCLGVFFAMNANAQQQTRVKPKLVPIVLNEKTNDPKALDIAKKLNPSFFEIDKNYMGGSPDAKFFARYLPLDKQNPKRFIVLTTSDNFGYCTARGCHIYFYENSKDNKWRQVLHWQSNGAWYDTNSKNVKFANIITQTVESAKNKVNVWMWSVNNYIEVTKR